MRASESVLNIQDQTHKEIVMNYEMQGKKAIVTGAASGIGLAIAETLARSGADVAIWDINPQLDNAVARVAALGVKCIGLKVDVSDAAAVAAATAETVKQLGGLDLAVNNAGIGGPSASSADYPLDGWDKVIAINLNGVYYCQREQLRYMREHGGGSIVNMASILGQVAFAGAPAYVAAKHGVVGLTKCAAVEHAQDNIRINSVGPAFVHTSMVDGGLPAEVVTALESKHAVGRLGQPQEIADLVAWLLSDAASFVTGAYYAADGGYLAV
ncbi:SDR family oxidoreductase [Oceanospirillaceae bacterium ASx5O]|nr:SDR family oxidoreductase [Oceanospirillaceae bacterium ASx5O]